MLNDYVLYSFHRSPFHGGNSRLRGIPPKPPKRPIPPPPPLPPSSRRHNFRDPHHQHGLAHGSAQGLRDQNQWYKEDFGTNFGRKQHRQQPINIDVKPTPFRTTPEAVSKIFLFFQKNFFFVSRFLKVTFIIIFGNKNFLLCNSKNEVILIYIYEQT